MCFTAFGAFIGLCLAPGVAVGLGTDVSSLWHCHGFFLLCAAFRRMFLPGSSLQWVSGGKPGSTAFPIACFVVTRLWPTSWLLGLLSFLAILIQRFSSCWFLTIVQWTILREMRSLKRPTKVRQPLALQRSLYSLPAEGEPDENSFSKPLEQQHASASAAESHSCPLFASPSPVAAACSIATDEKRTKPTAAAGIALSQGLRRRRSRFLDEFDPASGISAEDGRGGRFTRLLSRRPGNRCEAELNEKALIVPETCTDTKPEVIGVPPLFWWGGGEPEGPENARDRKEFRAGLRMSKLLLCLIVYGPPAALSAFFVWSSLPVGGADDTRFRASLDYTIVVHTEVFLRLLLGGIKCLHVAWLFGSKQQAERVGLLPLLVLGSGVVGGMSAPLLKVIFSFDRSFSVFLLLAALLASICLTVFVVCVQTASGLRAIFATGSLPRRSRKCSGGPSKGLQRSGARSLSSRGSAPLALNAGFRGISLESPFSVETKGGNSSESSFWKPVARRRPMWSSGHPYKRIAKVKGRKEQCGPTQCAPTTARVTTLFVRLLKSNLYWAFIGNVEILRADLNMAISGSPTKPLPMIWGWLLKFVATPWLLVEFVEHSLTLPGIVSAARAPHAVLALVLLGWILFVLGVLFYGAVFPDALEPFLPHRTLYFPNCWVPKISCRCRLAFLEDMNPKLFDSRIRCSSATSGNSAGRSGSFN